MDEKNPSSWDDLLNQIGVTPTSDADQRRRPAIETTFDPPPATASAHKPKPKPSDWKALANNLGIEAPAEPERPAAPERPAVHAGPRDVEAGFASIEPLESAFEEIIEEEIADVEYSDADGDDDRLFDDDDSDLEADAEDSDLSDASDLTDEEDELDDEPSDELPPSTLSGEAARSAFEALFQAGSRSGSPPPRREQQPADDIFGDAERPPRPPRPPRAERPRRVVDDVGDLSADRPSAEDEGDSSGEGQRPRRRRRRGGRGRDRDRDRNREGAAKAPRGEESVRRPPDRELDADDDQWVESHDEGAADRETEEPAGESSDRPRRRSRRGRGGRGRTSDETREAAEKRPAVRNGRRPKKEEKEVDEDDADDSDDMAAIPIEGDADGDDDDEGSSGRSVHKSIPSWSEAISVMVDTNMVARKNSPSRPSSQRGGRGRGRSRGGRGGSDRGGGDRGGERGGRPRN
jgi:hypothetical protein